MDLNLSGSRSFSARGLRRAWNFGEEVASNVSHPALWPSSRASVPVRACWEALLSEFDIVCPVCPLHVHGRSIGKDIQVHVLAKTF